MKRNRNSSILIFVTVLLCISSGLLAQKQKKDTLAPLREFISIVSSYKQIPLYMEMEVKNKTNLITTENDTAVLNGEVYLQKEDAYVRFGDYEQLVNDSTALIVMNKAEAMIIYENAEPVISQMKAMLGAAVPDSSIRQMAAMYSVTKTVAENSMAAIELRSRDELLKTGLPKVHISMTFDSKLKHPKQVKTTQRSLIPLDSVEYENLLADANYSDGLLKTDEGFYFIKVQESFITYKKLLLNREAEMAVPFLIKDRVGKAPDGEYKPVKGFEEYTLTKY